MKISNIEYRVQDLQPKVKFRIALTQAETRQTILIKIHTDEQLIGYGEANPFWAVTAETIPSALAFLEAVSPRLIGESPYAIERLHQLMDETAIGNSAAKAGLDIALYDLCAKGAGLPLYRYLGGSQNTVVSDMSIGIDEPQEMKKLAVKYVEAGFTILKIKVGLNIANDVEAIRLIREAVGPNVELRLDANQGWNAKSCLKALELMKPYHIDEIEQPVPYHDLAGLKYVKDHSSVPVMADEAMHSPLDALRLVKAEACDVLNIKLMKSAGIFPALKIVAISEAAGLNCMVGCMSETAVGIAAGAALVAAKKNITYADLDGHRLFHEIPGMHVSFSEKGGVMTLAEVPGHGVEFA